MGRTSEENAEANAEEGRSLRIISQGATLHFGGKVTSNLLNLVLNLLLTRGLGAVLYGIYTYANTLVGFFMVFARLGTGKSILRFLPANADNPARQNWIVAMAYLTALVSSILIGAGLFVLAPLINDLTLGEPELVVTLRIFAIALPFNAIINLTTAVFRALERLDFQIAVKDIAEPVIRITAVGAAFVLGHSLVGVVAAVAIGAVLILSIALSILYTNTEIRPTGTRSSGSVQEFYNFSLPLTLKDLGQKLYTRVDILMVGLFLSGATVGIYRISVLLTSFLTLPLSGVNQLFPPVASNLHSNGERDELEAVYRTITRWTFTIVIPPALALIIYSQEALYVFGDGFTGGSSVLILFAVAQMTNCAVGPSGYLLMMTDHQYVNLLNQWTLGVSNLVLNYLFILEFGFIGVAVATAGSLAAINVIRVVEVWYFEGMTPYSLSFLKPIAAGVVTIPVMAAWTFYLSGFSLLFVGSASGLIAFCFVLFLFGFEDEDKEFYAENVRPYLQE